GKDRDLFGRRRGLTGDERGRLRRLRASRRELRAAARRVAREGGAPCFAFESHFGDVVAGGGFDLVVGNPPWVRGERLPARVRETLSHRYPSWRPSAVRGFGHLPDLAVAFVERALELAAPGGCIALLVPAKLASSGYAEPLRQRLSHGTRIERAARLADAAGAFGAAAVYPMALIATCRGPGPADAPAPTARARPRAAPRAAAAARGLPRRRPVAGVSHRARPGPPSRRVARSLPPPRRRGPRRRARTAQHGVRRRHAHCGRRLRARRVAQQPVAHGTGAAARRPGTRGIPALQRRRRARAAGAVGGFRRLVRPRRVRPPPRDRRPARRGAAAARCFRPARSGTARPGSSLRTCNPRSSRSRSCSDRGRWRT